MKQDPEPEFTVGSGNVFADLDLPDPEQLLRNSELTSDIHRTIQEQGLTYAEAAAKIGLDPPILLAMLRGRLLSWFSTEELTQFLNTLKS